MDEWMDGWIGRRAIQSRVGHDRALLLSLTCLLADRNQCKSRFFAKILRFFFISVLDKI